MPYVPVPKDLTKVKTKVAFNLTKRQLLCFGVAAIIGVPTYLLCRGIVGNTFAVMIMIFVMLPFFFVAMFERDGQPAEKILANIIRHRQRPQHRPYKTENLYRLMSDRGKSKQEGENIAQKQNAGKAGKASAKQHQAGEGR